MGDAAEQSGGGTGAAPAVGECKAAWRRPERSCVAPGRAWSRRLARLRGAAARQGALPQARRSRGTGAAGPGGPTETGWRLTPR